MWWLLLGCALLFLYTFLRRSENHFRKAILTQFSFFIYAFASIASHAIAYTMALLGAGAGLLLVAWFVIRILV